MRAGIAALDGVRVLGDGPFHVVAMAGGPRAGRRVRRRRRAGDGAAGTSTAKARPTRCTRNSVSNSNVRVMDEYLADLVSCITDVVGSRSDDRSTNYATLE